MDSQVTPVEGHPASGAGDAAEAQKGAQPLAGQAAANMQQFFHDPSGKYKLVMQGAYAAVEASIVAGDTIKAESGAMVSMSNNVDLKARLEGSLGAACFRSCCAGEGLFMSHFSLVNGTRGEVLLSPTTPGDIILIHMDDDREWAIQKASYLASDDRISVGVKTQGCAAGCCSGEGFFVLKASGQGRLLVNSFGGVIRYNLQPGEIRKIDNGYLVAWHSDMSYTISKAGSSIVSSILSGEGFVTTFTGPGTVYAQTRSLQAFAMELRPYMYAQ